ncbi:hypothetical protein RRF57_010058 [Xylaria bambusicola]|uniref:Uncharacterized protein n=1 Tax=Xylaria bambusicola TaxID=326684 RepID=A0AAN7UUE4_9PEZI
MRVVREGVDRSPPALLIASAGTDEMIHVSEVATGSEVHSMRINTTLRHLAFSSCGSHLITDQGVFLLFSNEPRAPGSLSISRHWIHQDGKDVLYLPPDYQRNLAFISGNIACFQSSKHPLRIDLSSSKSMIY